MTQKQLLSFLGAGLLALGTFMPVVNMPFLGSINFLNNGQGDGVFILILAGAAALLSLTTWQRGVSVLGVLAAAVIAYDFYNLSAGIGNMQTEMQDDAFSSILATSVQMSYGWFVLALGAFVLIVVGLTESDSQEAA